MALLSATSSKVQLTPTLRSGTLCTATVSWGRQRSHSGGCPPHSPTNTLGSTPVMALTCTPGEVTETLLGRTRTWTHLLSSSAKPLGVEAPGQAPSRQHLCWGGYRAHVSPQGRGGGQPSPQCQATAWFGLISRAPELPLGMEALLISGMKSEGTGAGATRALPGESGVWARAGSALPIRGCHWLLPGAGPLWTRPPRPALQPSPVLKHTPAAVRVPRAEAGHTAHVLLARLHRELAHLGTAVSVPALPPHRHLPPPPTTGPPASHSGGRCAGGRG